MSLIRTCKGCRYLQGSTPNFTCLIGCFLGVLDADTALPIFACNHGPYKERQPSWYNLSLDVGINYADRTIMMNLRNATETISRWVIDTREAAVKDALIKLGWRPPE